MLNKLLFSGKEEEKPNLLLQHKSGGGRTHTLIRTEGRISLNGLKRFADSNVVFQFARKAGSKDKSIDIWISKNNRELAKRINWHGRSLW
jgi:hypothetical protein